MLMQCEMLLIRHAQAAGNKKGAYIGRRSDAALSGEGIMSLTRDSEYLRSLIDEPDYVYSSPLSRCLDSARAIYPESEPEIINDFAEMDFGDFEGKCYEELKDNRDYQQYLDSGGSSPFPRGENKSEFTQRVVKSLCRVIRQGKIAVIAHGGTIMAIMEALTGDNYFSFHVGNLEGYLLSFKTDDEALAMLCKQDGIINLNESIFDLSYSRINPGL